MLKNRSTPRLSFASIKELIPKVERSPQKARKQLMPGSGVSRSPFKKRRKSTHGRRMLNNAGRRGKGGGQNKENRRHQDGRNRKGSQDRSDSGQEKSGDNQQNGRLDRDGDKPMVVVQGEELIPSSDTGAKEEEEDDVPERIKKIMMSIKKKAKAQNKEYSKYEMRFRCAVCKKPTLMKCSGCLQVSYCCKEHQMMHWPSHKPHCHQRRGTLMLSSDSNTSKLIFLIL